MFPKYPYGPVLGVLAVQPYLKPGAQLQRIAASDALAQSLP